MNEFQLIDHYFLSKAKKNRKDVLLGIGDDAAIVRSNEAIAISVDTLVSGVHFPVNTKPFDVGYKSLAVNLSDLAAMGAEPAWVTLSLTLPAANKKWLAEFSKGFFLLLKKFNLQLIGGDTTRGPLAITVQVHGFLSPKNALQRNQAKKGDKIYVTGNLGDAGLALSLLKKNYSSKLFSNRDKKYLQQKLNRPLPQIEIGLALRGISRCAIDISDGLAADLGHILNASKVGAVIFVEKLPLSTALQKLPKKQAYQYALSSGDDYELCFTVPPAKEKKLEQMFKKYNYPLTCIGIIEKQTGLRIIDQTGNYQQTKTQGFEHF